MTDTEKITHIRLTITNLKDVGWLELRVKKLRPQVKKDPNNATLAAKYTDIVQRVGRLLVSVEQQKAVLDSWGPPNLESGSVQARLYALAKEAALRIDSLKVTMAGEVLPVDISLWN